jgi:hypothetical protein
MSRLSDFISTSIDLSVTRGYHLWWRGQADKTWPLLPSVYRRERGHRFEKNAVSKFVQRAPAFHATCPAKGDRPGWLGFMQHHGLPTRLLDWSESPLTAAYFAASEAPDRPGRIWALDPFLLNGHFWQSETILEPHGTPNSLFQPPFVDGAEEIEKVAAVPAYYVDAKMKAQLAAFTVHGTTTPLDQIPESPTWLQSIEVPAEHKANLVNELFAFGIRRSVLFPDLQSLAQEIAGMNFVR